MDEVNRFVDETRPTMETINANPTLSCQRRSVDEPPAAGNAYCFDGLNPTHPNLTGGDFLFRWPFVSRSASGARGFRLTALAQILRFCRIRVNSAAQCLAG